MTSLVNDVMMPPIGKLLGGVDFSNFFVVLGTGEYASLKAAKDAGAATVNYGLFLQYGHQLHDRGLRPLLRGAWDEHAQARAAAPGGGARPRSPARNAP